MLSRASAIALSLILLVACGTPLSSPVDVEGTVQARVTASVGALERVPATPSRPAATSVIAVGTASPPAASGTAARTAPAGGATAATQQGSVAASASRPAGTASPALGSGTPVPLGTAAGTSLATPIPAATAVGRGNAVRLGGIAVTVSHYQWGYECPSGTGKPPAGNKLVTLEVAERNDGSSTLPAPPLVWTVAGSGVSTGSQSPCQPDEQALVNTCYRSAELPAGARCEGWLVFEVPESLDVPGSIVQARYAGGSDVATWRIPPPSS